MAQDRPDRPDLPDRPQHSPQHPHRAGRDVPQAGLRRRLEELEGREDRAAHALRHDLALLLAPRRPGQEQAPSLVLRAPQRTKTPPSPHEPPRPHGRFAVGGTPYPPLG